MKIKTLVDRFGSNRMNAAEPAKLLGGCSCVAVPFAGGLCEIPYFTANVVLVNDLDRAVLNLAAVVREECEELVQMLEATPFHPDVLAKAQERCRGREADAVTLGAENMKKLAPCYQPNLDWAFDYFIASWMTRGGKGGAEGEFDADLSIRWKSGGGDSVVRFRNATESLAEWQEVMRRCTFTTLDVFDFLEQCGLRDVAENGIYIDPPWPDDGDKYRHKFTEQMQRKLANRLTMFMRTRVVVRFGDHALIRELYPEPAWSWNRLTGRTQANSEKSEVLLTRNCPDGLFS